MSGACTHLPTARLAAPRRVLVIDDEPLVARAVARVLVPDHAVTLAPDGATALARVAAGETWDAIVCDLRMPGLSGLDVHAALARVAPPLAARVVFASGSLDDPRFRPALAALPNPRLAKPFTRAALAAAVARVAG